MYINNTETNTPNKAKRLNSFLTAKNDYNQTIAILNQKESCENLK